jgi:predicted Zn-dependent peptidase
MRLDRRLVAALCASSFLVTACEENLPPPVIPTVPPPVPTASVAPTATAAAPDPLGAKPTLAPPKAYDPPAPQVFTAANGMTVWLLERRALPLVSVSLAIPTGSAADPAGEQGLSWITANMLDEGAGARSAVQISTAIDDLGGSLGTGASADGSFANLSVLKKNFGAAFKIFSDVVARPRLDAKEWKRVSDLWKNDLKKRASDADDVSRVAATAVLFGSDAPYGHPADGRTATAAKISLAMVKSFYSSAWRPDQATLVVAGDITKDEVLAAIADGALGSWKAPKTPKLTPIVPPPPPAATALRVVLIDRPADAAQAVLVVVRDGVAASDPKAPLLGLVNTALGGSFTSRLNQNLREEHGWTYGAGSRFGETRGVGSFAARASVVTEATGPALEQMLLELNKMATSGLSDDEVAKVLAQDRADLVQNYEGVGGIASRLAKLSMLGLPPDFDTTASRAAQQATRARLAELATAVDPKATTILVVGPRAAVLPQLAKIKLPNGQPLPAPESWDAEGYPIVAK